MARGIMVMKYASIIAAVSFFALTSSAVTSRALAETAAQRLACTPDVWRLCSSDIPNVAAIKACLRQEHAKLSSACRTVMDTYDKPSRSTVALTAN